MILYRGEDKERRKVLGNETNSDLFSKLNKNSCAIYCHENLNKTLYYAKFLFTDEFIETREYLNGEKVQYIYSLDKAIESSVSRDTILKYLGIVNSYVVDTSDFIAEREATNYCKSFKVLNQHDTFYADEMTLEQEFFLLSKGIKGIDLGTGEYAILDSSVMTFEKIVISSEELY